MCVYEKTKDIVHVRKRELRVDHEIHNKDDREPHEIGVMWRGLAGLRQDVEKGHQNEPGRVWLRTFHENTWPFMSGLH